MDGASTEDILATFQLDGLGVNLQLHICKECAILPKPLLSIFCCNNGDMNINWNVEVGYTELGKYYSIK